ncbi:hypothetical protein L6Q79_06280 [bacterium]|nr:hypothetical protein [bacterium]NUN44362.1 hypothetical protein [bacterium]
MNFDYLNDQAWIVNQDIPWKHLSKDLSEVRIAIITTAGLYMWKTQKPFSFEDEIPDVSFREIPNSVTQETVRVSHRYMDLFGSAGVDINSVFPIHRLQEMVSEKRIGGLAETHYSVMGEVRDPRLFIEDCMPKILKLLQKQLVDVVLVTPGGPLGHQTAGMIARFLEENDITTITIGAVKAIAQNVKSPRTLLVRYPFGMYFGAPFDADNQKEIVNECLVHLKAIREPGEVSELSVRWQDTFKTALQIKPELPTLMDTGAIIAEPVIEKKKIAADEF